MNILDMIHKKKGQLLDKCEDDISQLTTKDISSVCENIDHIAHILAYELDVEPSDDWSYPSSNLLELILKENPEYQEIFNDNLDVALSLRNNSELDEYISRSVALYRNEEGYVEKAWRAITNGSDQIGERIANREFPYDLEFKCDQTDKLVNNRNLLFVSSFKPHPHYDDFLDLDLIDFNDAQILKDEYPAFEMLNGNAALEWRRGAIKNGI